MIRMGIDASTHITGYCVFDDDVLKTYGKIKAEETLSWRERIVFMMQELAQLVQEYNPEELCLEVPIKTIKNVNTLEQLFSLHGALIGMAATLHVRVIPVEVSSWRKQLGMLSHEDRNTVKRNALKEKSVKMANQLYNLDLVYKSPNSKYNDDDISDSILICHTIIHKHDRGFGI